MKLQIIFYFRELRDRVAGEADCFAYQIESFIENIKFSGRATELDLITLMKVSKMFKFLQKTTGIRISHVLPCGFASWKSGPLIDAMKFRISKLEVYQQRF